MRFLLLLVCMSLFHASGVGITRTTSIQLKFFGSGIPISTAYGCMSFLTPVLLRAPISCVIVYWSFNAVVLYPQWQFFTPMFDFGNLQKSALNGLFSWNRKPLIVETEGLTSTLQLCESPLWRTLEMPFTEKFTSVEWPNNLQDYLSSVLNPCPWINKLPLNLHLIMLHVIQNFASGQLTEIPLNSP